jgi:NAD(P)-dependent dehydrogenase (short-subunit alcohol dehydrogenase family)
MSLVFLVTGSSRGLGRAIVGAALDAGHRVVGTARRPAQLDDLVARYAQQVAPIALDVTDYGAAVAAVQAAAERFGRLDVVVNNAGYADLGS